MGFLIAIEGVDGSGKQTQTKELLERLKKENRRVMGISFPNYDSPASSLVKMYLGGAFGQDAQSINAYQASTFFAADRYASWMTGPWRSVYEEGGLIIADRYTTANMLHQAGKIEDPDERQNFLSWLEEFEYGLYGIPRPDLVFYLDMPLDFQAKLTKDRHNKIDDSLVLDIHEANKEHLKKSAEAAASVIDRFGWHRIECVKEGSLRSIDDIADEIFKKVLETQSGY